MTETTSEALPTWFHRGLVLALTGVTSLGLVGVVLAMAGFYDPAPVAALTLAVWFAASLPWTWRWVGGERPATRPNREWRWATVIVVVLVAAITVFNVRYASQHLRTNRDAGTYNVIGALMAEEGDLLFPIREGPFAEHEELEHTGFAFYDVRSDDNVYAQFVHMLPAILGVGMWAGGAWLLVKVNALLGGLALLAVYAFATRLVRPWFALAGTAILGLNLAQVWFSRDSYTEILTQLLIFGGLWVLWEARKRWSIGQAAVGGLLIGATAVVRVDAYVYLPALAVYLLVEWMAARRRPPPERRERRHFSLAISVGALFAGGIGLLNGRAFSPQYMEDLAANIETMGLLVGATIVGVLVVGAIGERFAGLARRVWAHHRRIGAVAALLVVALGLFAWFVRPHVEYTTLRPNDLVAGIQERDNLPIDPVHTYGEDSMRWLAWYLGPVTLAAGIGGIALLTARFFFRRDSFRLLLFLGLFAAGAVVYIYRPSINPDHPWAIRRFLPVAIPGFIVAASYTAELLWGMGRKRLRIVGRVAGVTVVGVGILFAVNVLWPLRTVRAEVPFVSVTEDLCDRVEGGAVVVLETRNLGNSLPQSVRAFCDVPTARANPDLGIGFFRQLGDEWQAEGHRLYLVHNEPDPFGSGLGLRTETLFEGEVRYFEPTLERRPDRILTTEAGLYVTVP